MHTLLILSSLALALGACLVCLWLLRLARSSTSRRTVQLTGLLTPAVVLGLLAAMMVHFVSIMCFWAAPLADVVLAQVLSLVGAVGVILAVLLNGARAVLLPLHIRRCTWEAPAWLEERVANLVSDMALGRDKLKAPGVRVTADPRPSALVTGLFRPYIIVSSGLIGMLDDEELDGVLCHELMHLRRGDIWWTTIGAVLRDLTRFLPGTRRLYDLLLTEQEVVCDDRVLGESRRLALAGALARVWQSQLNGNSNNTSDSTPHGALALFSQTHASQVEARIRRLLDRGGHTRTTYTTPYKAMSIALSLLGIFVGAQIWLDMMAMDAMGCGLQAILMAMPR